VLTLSIGFLYNDAYASHLTCNGLTTTIDGTAGNDILTGTQGNDVIHALGGNDIIYGLGGNDTICGGEGHDIIYGGDGNDTLLAERGNDTVYGNDGNDTINGSLGRDLLFGGDGLDTLIDVDGLQNQYSGGDFMQNGIAMWNSRIPMANTMTTVDSVGNVGVFSSITIGMDGLPVISYWDIANGDLKVAKCGSPTCVSNWTR
jgi:hypothetical protein